MSSADSPQHTCKPSWLKVRAPGSAEFVETKGLIKGLRLHTVCEEARCPNIGDCWSHKTATFLIMGDRCTRHCRFCSVTKSPHAAPLDGEEPERVARAVHELALRHAVITSVTRDDLPDGGGEHFAATVAAVKRGNPGCEVEVLIPDFGGHHEALRAVVASGVDVLNHNLETVERLYPAVRPQAIYHRSLTLLRQARGMNPALLTKSGIMVGLGEEKAEVLRLMDDLRAVDCSVLTIGQYLQPSASQLPIARYVHPEEFQDFEHEALARGFRFVESGALVRSSYHAWKHSPRLKTQQAAEN